MVPTRRLAALSLVPFALAVAALAWPVLEGLVAGSLFIVLVLAGIDVWGARGSIPPVLERRLPARMTRGVAGSVVYRIYNPGALPVRASLLDELPEDLGGDRWLRALRLEPGQRLEFSKELEPRRRGRRPLGPTYLSWCTALGLFWRREKRQDRQLLEVLPNPGLTQSRQGLLHRSAFRQLGVRPRRPRGEGFEFESLREYVPGDDPRHLDWRATARSRRLIVRQHQVEKNHSVIVAVDTGRLMGTQIEGRSKLDHALDCALGLVYASRMSGDKIGLCAFDRDLRCWVPPISASRSPAALVDATLPLEPRPLEPSYPTLGECIARHQSKRALVVVLTDFVEGASSPDLEAYLGLMARRHCVLLVALRDRLLDELNAPAPKIQSEALYRRLVLQDLEVERQTALGRIARLGVQTLDIEPSQVTAPVLNRYLEIRQAGLL